MTTARTPGDSGGFETASFLHPPHLPLDLCVLGDQRHEVLVGAPREEQAQVGLGVDPGSAGIATQVSRGRQCQDEIRGSARSWGPAVVRCCERFRVASGFISL